MGIASSRQRQQNNQEVEVNDNQVINERSAEDDRRQRRHLLSDEDNRGANDDGKYWIFSLKKLSRIINISNSKILWHKKLICGIIAAIIGIDRRNNEGEGSSAIRGNRRGKKRVRRYLRHMEDENDCNTSDDELQDNTNSVVSKIFNWLQFGWF